MSKSKTTSTQTQTATPSNPEWVTQGVQGLSGNITNLAGQDPRSFVAGASGLQDQQFGLAGQMGQNAGGYLSQAASLAGGAAQGYNPAQMQAAQVAPTALAGDASHAQATSALGGIASYQNPYEQTVVNSTLADLDRARQMTQNGNGQGAIASGQYGGSRQGVLDANTNRDFIDRAGAAIGGLRSQGFNTALDASNQDANRAQATNIFNAGADNSNSQFNASNQNATNLAQAGYQQQAGLANQGATNTAGQFGAGQGLQSAQLLSQLGLSGYDALASAGGTQQGINQGLAGAPLSVLQGLAGAQGGLDYGLFKGGTTTGSGTGTSQGSFLDSMGKVVQIGANAAAAFSDERLKTDVRPIGKDGRGRDWYDYRYMWDAPDVTRRGVMAQQILATDPHAVLTHESGFLMVDYSKLEG